MKGLVKLLERLVDRQGGVIVEGRTCAVEGIARVVFSTHPPR